MDDFSFTEDELDRLDIIFADEPSYIKPSTAQLAKLKEVNLVTVDKDFFMVYDVEQYFDMRRNQQGLYENNFLHVWKVYASGYFANAVMYVETEPTVTGVTVAPTQATMPKGSSLTMKATVAASDFADKTVHWEVTDVGTDVTINEKTGVLTIGNNATAKAYVVKAVSNGDPKKFGTATITAA